jgi:MFS superfamily sulfate permease-like transporter
MGNITVSMDLVVGILLGIVVPTFLWALKMFSMVKQTRDMHLEPDEYGFGNDTTNKLLTEHFETEGQYHRQYIESNNALRHVVRELSHFMRWMVKESTGKEPPPYVRKNGD